MESTEYKRAQKQLAKDGVTKHLRSKHPMAQPRKYYLLNMEVFSEIDDAHESKAYTGPITEGDCMALTFRGAFESLRVLIDDSMHDFQAVMPNTKVFISDMYDTENPHVKLVVASAIITAHNGFEDGEKHVREFYIIDDIETAQAMIKDTEELSQFVDYEDIK